MQNRFTEDIRSRVSITKSYMNDIYEFEFRESIIYQCMIVRVLKLALRLNFFSRKENKMVTRLEDFFSSLN